jgi:Icc-related predicted phosphoesterase
MKILHYSDRNSPDFYNLYNQCEVLVVTGDLTVFDFPGLEIEQNRKPAFGVYGNHDSGQYFEELGITNLHKKIIEFNGLKWGGFQGCIKYKETGIMYSEEEAREWAKSFPYVDVLLLHAGPKGLLDDPSDPVHIGSEAIRQYVLDKKPKYVFCGHQYDNAEMKLEATQIYRSFKARIIDI